MKVQKVQEVLCSGFLDVLRLSSLRSRYLSVYEKVRLFMMKKCTVIVYLCTYLYLKCKGDNGRVSTLDLNCVD